MDANFYSDMQDTVTEMLDEFGTEALLAKFEQGAYDPTTGDVAAAEFVQYPFLAIMFPEKDELIDGKKYIFNDEYHSGTGIKYRTLTLFLSANPTDGSLNIVPAQMDKITWQGVEYTLVEVQPVSPAGVPLFYEVTARA